MRFDDSLATVLAADVSSPAGAEAAWRQLCDLTGRRRVEDVDGAVARLDALRGKVSAAVRGASGRALTRVEPPVALVTLFAGDDLAIAAPVLRTARLSAAEWLTLLPLLSPPARSVLRHRRDLPASVVRGLQSFGATDFVLGHDTPTMPVDAKADAPIEPAADVTAAAPGYEIADLVARIDAFRRDRPLPPAIQPAAARDHFQFHADAAGVIRWVEGVARTSLIGVALAGAARQGLVHLPSPIALASRRAFRDLALNVEGDTSAAGNWLLAGEPRFDRQTGRFIGFAGTARRRPAPPAVASASDTLRQLVHELRTPANAMAGFAELIATELLGAVTPVYRERATLIQQLAGGLTGAIDDLDVAARIEGRALEVRNAAVDLLPILTGVLEDLGASIRQRGVVLTTQLPGAARAVTDDRVARQLVGRLIAIAVAAAEQGERLHVQVVAKPRSIRLHVTRPRGIAAADDGALFAIDGSGAGGETLPLGVGFTLRLVRSLAAASGGSLVIAADRLTLRLPAVAIDETEQATAR